MALWHCPTCGARVCSMEDGELRFSGRALRFGMAQGDRLLWLLLRCPTGWCRSIVRITLDSPAKAEYPVRKDKICAL